MFRVSLLLLALFSAAACSTNATVLSPTSFYGAYSPTVLSYASTRGGILTEITGNPFDVPQEELDQVVVRSMKGAHFGPAVDFISTPPDEFTSPYRVVMVFDAARHHTEAKLCGLNHGIEAQPGDHVRVHAALCANESPLTAVSGSVGEADGPNDPRFQHLIRQITTNLFPPYNPDRRNTDRRGSGGGTFLRF